MRRALIRLVVLVAVAAALGFGAFHLGDRLGSAHSARQTDDLEWLRMEFRLNVQEMARIRQLHEGYLPQCRSYCERIAAGKRQLKAELAAGTNAPPLLDQKLAEIASLRAQCQAAMLRHFDEVSRAMPPEQGRRYLAEMQRLTIGAHETIEDSMSSPLPAAHDHH